MMPPMERLSPVVCSDDIFDAYRDTPVGELLEYHNLGRPFDTSYDRARLLVGMCMDHRKHLRIPENFAYIIRAGGANLRYSEFKVSYAISVGGVRAIALVGHTNCGMVNLMSRRELFIEGMVEGAGWERPYAEQHFNQFAPMFEIVDEVDFVLAEAKRLRHRYPKILVAPLIYRVENNQMYLVHE